MTIHTDDFALPPGAPAPRVVSASAASAREEALDHVLLFGTPGLGKTTLSHIIAHELGVSLRQTSGPVLEKPKDLAALLTSLDFLNGYAYGGGRSGYSLRVKKRYIASHPLRCQHKQ